MPRTNFTTVMTNAEFNASLADIEVKTKEAQKLADREPTNPGFAAKAAGLLVTRAQILKEHFASFQTVNAIRH